MVVTRICKQIDLLEDLGVNFFSHGVEPTTLFRSQLNRRAAVAFEHVRFQATALFGLPHCGLVQCHFS
jgi:hypothetical protein